MHTSRVGSFSSRSPTIKKVLFLAYYFPPVGGSGIQRTLKFVKFLPRNGWAPLIVTVKPISYYVYDHALTKQVPETTFIRRTGSLDPFRLSALLFGDKSAATTTESVVHHDLFKIGSPFTRLYRAVRPYLFFPDPNMGWLPFALWHGLTLIRRHKPRIIFTPVVPYTSTIVAFLLSKMSGVPYVIDFRDPWTDDMEGLEPETGTRTGLSGLAPTGAHQKLHRKLERLIVTNAGGVSVYGEHLAHRLRERYPGMAEPVVIPNGFDPDDAAAADLQPLDTDRRHIVFTGSLYPSYEPNVRTLIAALQSLPDEVRDRLKITFVGQTDSRVRDMVETSPISGLFEFVGYKSHRVALGYLKSADASLLFVRSGDRVTVTGKVFELLMMQKPIIALIEPTGACADTLKQAHADSFVRDPDDVEGVAAILARVARGEIPQTEIAAVRIYSREYQASQLGELFNSLDKKRQTHPTSRETVSNVT